ncbi:hypothetical protein GOP47_0011611 [Adiantum capillus-veneris]|uniref:PAR1 protein n=1 Tax=Adiantum capillus-veneris TaxID=13818 RepID=A0A9D4ZFK1_ADICA|nr:hypothetical protein GOP47_0011611 [Adiantum capillus-veneris]
MGMAGQKQSLVLVSFVMSILVSGISATLLCEDLPIDLCAFAVSSSASRCILEKEVSSQGKVEYQCQTSDVSANEFAEWVETDDCVHACGIDRQTVGLSSDSFVESGFVKALCSIDCQNGCPNVVDLFEKLAAGEGVSLSRVCEVQSMGAARRAMNEVENSHFASLSAHSLNAWEASNAALSPFGSLNPQGSLDTTSPAAAPSQI